MELGQGTRRNLNAQRCTLSSIGFSVFSLCLYVLVYTVRVPIFVNQYSCLFIRKTLSPALCVLLTTCNHDPETYIPHREMAGLSGFSQGASKYAHTSTH